MVLGDDQHGVSELRQHLEAASREAELSLDRLIGVSHAGDRDHLRPPALRRELLAEELRRVSLDEDLGLEVETGGETERLVGGARETIVSREPGGVERTRRRLDVDHVRERPLLDRLDPFGIDVHLAIEERFPFPSDPGLTQRKEADPIDLPPDEPEGAGTPGSRLEPEMKAEETSVAGYAFEHGHVDLRDPERISIVAFCIEEAGEESPMVAPRVVRCVQ